MKKASCKKFLKTVFAVLFAFMLTYAYPAQSAEKEKEKKPYPVYWMSVSTTNQSIPGMQSSEEMPGIGGLVMGKMMGKMGMGSGKNLFLQLNSPEPLPSEPEATHDIPPGQNMGKTLPLVIPPGEKIKPEKYEETERPPYEKPKMRMLIYWGCGENIGKGQPRVIDTEKMSAEEFGKAFATGHTPSPQYPPRPRQGWIYSEWPNKKDSTKIPKDSSLQGDQLIHGNYIPEIKFSIGKMNDFMATVELSSKGSPAESMRVAWKPIPTAIGYLATAMGNNQKTGEMIIWSSSEVPETGFGLMDYLSSPDVRKFIKGKVVMDPKVTSCDIPKGIFNDAPGMLQFIAYGEDLHAAYPPKPKDPKEFWDIKWAARVRLKSTGMMPLGVEGGEGTKRPAKKGKMQDEESSTGAQKSGQEEEGNKNPLKKFKGMFGF